MKDETNIMGIKFKTGKTLECDTPECRQHVKDAIKGRELHAKLLKDMKIDPVEIVYINNKTPYKIVNKGSQDKPIILQRLDEVEIIETGHSKTDMLLVIFIGIGLIVVILRPYIIDYFTK